MARLRYRPCVRAIAVLLLTGSVAHADPRPAPAVLTDLALVGDDARKAIAIGPAGQVYEPDGKGAWLRERPIATAGTIAVVGRANGGTAIVALADGAVYRLADNGWSALRLVQKGKAVMSSGRSIAAVGRQLFALDKLAGGEVGKLATAPQPVQLIGAGDKAITIQTERGLLRADGPKAAWKPIARAPRRVSRLIDDRWALTDRGAVDLKTGTETPWPAGFRVGAATPGPKGSLVVTGAHRGTVELVVIEGVKITRETIAPAPPPDATVVKADPKAPGSPPEKDRSMSSVTAPLADPVGVVVDPSGRVVVAFRDGRLALRVNKRWSVTTTREALPTGRPGAAPARSP